MASQSGYQSSSASPKLRSKDLPSKRLLGTGLASVGYETELNGRKCARKDFMGVPSRTFRREAARLVGLEDHINVVKTLGWTESKMSCSLVLEYMDDDLLGFLQKRKQSQGSLEAGPNSGNQSDIDSRNTIKLAPFELPEALDFMVQIARGMEFLSARGIRHGNLKSKNILVARSNDRDRNSLSLKVADFGLVRTRRKSTAFASRQARKLDMARWTAPELLEVFLLEDKGETSSESDSDEDCTDSSDVADSDVPEWRELGADVYSFAVTCSQILTGEDPYPNHLNWKELGVKIVRHGLTPTLPAACPAELRELLESCWSSDLVYSSDDARPSFSYIRRKLERLQKLCLVLSVSADAYLHESFRVHEEALMDTKREAPTDIKRQASMEIKGRVIKGKVFKGRRVLMGGKVPMKVEGKVPMEMRRKDLLREFMPEREPTDVVREIGLREPITVEDLWGPERLQHASRRLRHHHKSWQLSEYQALLFDFARLITETRTVVGRRTEWTLLTEDLELMLPDMLRIRNRWFGYQRTWDLKTFYGWGLPVFSWMHRLRAEVLFTSDEVRREYQQQDNPLPWPAEPLSVSELRNNWNQLAKQQTEIMLHMIGTLREAQMIAKGLTPLFTAVDSMGGLSFSRK